MILAAQLIVGVLVATASFVRTARHDGIEDRRRELANLALTLAEQTARVFQGLDFIADDLIGHMNAEGIETRAQLRAAMGTQAVHALLQARLSAVPQADWLAIIDDSGQLVNSSRIWPVPDTDMSERETFRVLSSAASPPLFIGEPAASARTGRIAIPLARRFTDGGGRFLGLVQGAMEQSYLERFYGAIRLGSDGMIALVRADGGLLARHPGSAGLSDRDPAMRARTIGAVFAAATDGLLPPGTLDEKERIAALQPLPGLPLSMVVSDSRSAVESVLWQRALPLILAAGLLCCAIALITYGAVRLIRGERAIAAAEHAMARREPLTGLANRLAFTERLEALLAKSGTTPAFSLHCVDLDDFKAVNDTLGHEAGDLLLVEFARRIRGRLAPGDIAARLGGDEFGILRLGTASNGEALTFAQGVIEALEEPFVIGHHRVTGGCSIGIALSPAHGIRAEQLQHNADLALYRAKSDGRGVARVFLEEMEASASARRELELDLHAAWREQHFFLAYQPIFEAASGRLAGFEALARWPHPERGLVPPEVFIPIAEETGLIQPLGAWALQEACRAAAEWPPHLFVSVNLSPLQFRGAQAHQHVRAALQDSGLPPERLELEITESTLLKQGPAVRATLDQIAADGVTLALDDFGTGYSSLGYLRTLTIGRIKVDRSFVEDVERSPQSLAIVRTILSLARTLSLRCTAEGIQTEGQRSILVAEGCTHLQGFLLGHPTTAEEALALARATAA
ncbi:putative bifunctional diguanylate cyclase/phosphodiesterase [Xanthobacter autotrophicus]|uniref:putative bifunctional diguanylate cyclase/phosphodiesterase n=1 Tax=Xanthobacter autotrophicus TaxID=280 RepID=UPI0024ACDFFF|nr:EAL domain-containing protein [Xanthobacter autotrophicus]